jgi:nucleoside-diphosphate-sugar epimerase
MSLLGPRRDGSTEPAAQAPPPDKHRVLILGGGFGGLYAAQQLRRAPVEVTLVDRRNFHLFQPLLYQVATGGLSPGDISSPIRRALRKQRNARVLLGEAIGLDADRRLVELRGGERLPYDSLVVATGARHHYFGNEDWERKAPGLKSIEDATELRSRILLAFERGEREPDPATRRALLNFVIVGAGPTGVELAGAICELARDTLRHDFRSIDPREARVLLVEGADRVLPVYPTDLSAKARKALERLGAEVRVDTLVEDLADDSVTLESNGQRERVPTGCVLWAAGVRRRARLLAFGPLGDLCHRGHRELLPARRATASWRGAGRHAAGPLCGAGDRAAPGGSRLPAVPLPGQGQHSHHRAQSRRGRLREGPIQRLSRLAALVRGARVVPDRVREPRARGAALAVELRDAKPRDASHYRERGRPVTPSGAMQKVLVTGATGFIGYEVASQLTARGLRPRLMVRRPERGRLLAPLDADLVFGDLARPASLVRAVEGVDTVLHLAARATFERYERVRPSIVDGSVALMRASRDAGVERFVFASSLLVYGGAEAPIDARTSPRPRIGYGVAKLEAEAALRREVPPEMKLSMVRLPHVYGARSFLFDQLRRRFVLFPGSGRNVYAHLHVEDAARVLVEVAARGWSGTSPVADEDPSSWNDFFAVLAQHYPRLRVLRIPERLALAVASILEEGSRLRSRPTLFTADTVRGWLLNLAVEPGLLWKELGLEPNYRSIDTGLPASLDDAVAFRWLHPVADRARA